MREKSERRLKNWLRTYAQFTHNSEAPDVFNFWTGVSTIAGALRKQVWIDEIKFRWVPNFYIIFVAPAGIVNKSTTLEQGISLLTEVPNVVMGPDSMTWQALTNRLGESLIMVQLPNGLKEGEKDLMHQEFMPMSAITCAISELGTFLKPDDDELVSALIDLWDGRSRAWSRWLKSSGDTKIENPWINVIGATTPSWLQHNFNEIMIGGGLTSRCIFVYADAKRMFVPYISRRISKEDSAKLREDLTHDLIHISKLVGEMKLEEEAYKLGEAWYIDHWTNTPQHLQTERYQGYVARKQTHIHKLAMILSAAERDDLIITKEHLQLSIAFITGIEADMAKVFDSIGASDSGKKVNELMSILNAYGRMTKKELWRMCMKSMAPNEFNDAITSAVTADFLSLKNEGGVVYYTSKMKKRKKEGEEHGA